MSHRDFLAKISGNRAYILNPQASWNFRQKPRSNPIPKFSSQAEIEVVTLSRPKFKLPSLEAKGGSYIKSFVLSSPSASFNRLLVDEELFSDSPVVV